MWENVDSCEWEKRIMRLCEMKIETIKNQILKIAEKGTVDDDELLVGLGINHGFRNYLKAIKELLDEGKIEKTFEPVPGTSYDMSYKLATKLKDEDKHYCWNEHCQNEIPEPVGCCSGRDCGCMGQPIDPPFCSKQCQKEHLFKREE